MGILSIIGMIIVGFIVGVLARYFYPGAVPLGFWMTVLLGIGGSLVGGVLTSLLWKIARRQASTAPAGSCPSWAHGADLGVPQLRALAQKQRQLLRSGRELGQEPALQGRPPARATPAC